MKFYGTLAALTAMVLSLSAVTVDPGKAVIVVKKDADGVIQFAGRELQKYLHKITGKLDDAVSIFFDDNDRFPRIDGDG